MPQYPGGQHGIEDLGRGKKIIRSAEEPEVIVRGVEDDRFFGQDYEKISEIQSGQGIQDISFFSNRDLDQADFFIIVIEAVRFRINSDPSACRHTLYQSAEAGGTVNIDIIIHKKHNNKDLAKHDI